MIYFDIKDKEKYEGLNKHIKLCLDYIENNDLSRMNDGSYTLNDDVYFNLFCYKTDESSKRIWEAHKKFIDLHVIIEGIEYVEYELTKDLEVGLYEEETDFLPLNGDCLFNVVLEEGKILILYPEDAHKTGVKINESKKVRKAVFKIKL